MHLAEAPSRTDCLEAPIKYHLRINKNFTSHDTTILISGTISITSPQAKSNENMYTILQELFRSVTQTNLMSI